MTTSDEVPAVDVKQAHVSREWKYSAPLLGCRFDPTGRFLFGSAMDATIQRWDLENDKHATFTGHTSWLRAIGFSPDSQKMFSAGYEGKLCVWDATAHADDEKPIKPVREFHAHDGWIRALVVRPQGDMVVTAGNDLAIKCWSTETGELLQTLAGHEKHIYSLMFHPNGEWLLSGDLQGVVHVWDVASGDRLRSFDAKGLYTYHGGQRVDYGGVRCMALSEDTKQLACGGLHKATNPFAGVQEPLVLVFDWESGQQIRTHEATGIPRGIVWRLVYEPSGILISGIGGDAGFVLFWKQEKNELHKLKLPSPALDLDRHPTRPDVAAACHDGRLRIVRLAAKDA